MVTVVLVCTALFSVTMPTAVSTPPCTLFGTSVSVPTPVGVTCNLTVFVTVPSTALTLTIWFAITCGVEMMNATCDQPAGTVTVAGTETSPGLALESATTAPPARSFTRQRDGPNGDVWEPLSKWSDRVLGPNSTILR